MEERHTGRKLEMIKQTNEAPAGRPEWRVRLSGVAVRLGKNKGGV